ncbi:hypothetical protein [Paenibacillus sp. GCM10012306]|uniref:hypothetical protein n=1 Tax=Paenibacillus sp. GCM10012306 TaxID=3317342 RepID=UPI0036D3D60A
MGHGDQKEQNRFMGDGFEPEPTHSMVDWGGSDGFSLWDAATDTSEENWMKDWEGRQETHDMFHNSYE